MEGGCPVGAADRGRRVAPQEVWDAVRDDYGAGLSARACCRRHGVGLTALYRRAALEHWRRVDQPWRPAADLAADEGAALEAEIAGDIDKINPRDLSWVASRRMMRAVLRGDAAGALRWRRVRLAMDLEEDEVQRWLAEQDAVDPVDVVDPVDPVDATASDGIFRTGEPGADDPFQGEFGLLRDVR